MNAADLPEKPRRVKITVDVPVEEIDAFHAMVREFHCGTTKHHAELRQHAEDREQGATSLSHLYNIAQGSSGQCRFIARFIAGLYNGTRFPFDLTDFRGLDRELFEHCLAVLRLDYQPVKEAHRYFDDGQSKWERMVKDWDIKDRSEREQSP